MHSPTKPHQNLKSVIGRRSVVIIDLIVNLYTMVYMCTEPYFTLIHSSVIYFRLSHVGTIVKKKEAGPAMWNLVNL